MSQEAIKRVAFLGKAPTTRHDLHWILRLSDRFAERQDGQSGPMPDNVIPFPGPRRGGRKGSRR